jgi:predicted AlkP superfamily pyrophosphatase or phosphodiesterase
MQGNSRQVLISILFAVLALSGFTSFGQKEEPSVLLVSFDGFRHDYIDKYDLKNFKEFRNEGASADGLIPCYPSLTFPNHYSIVTGLRPGRHGLVDNNFYDSALNLTYAIANRTAVSDARFYGGTPLWVLAKNGGLKTASYFWVGSEVADETRRPDTYFLYDAKVDFKVRIDTVLAWLRKDDSHRPRLITLYFSEPDHTSHESGPNSLEVKAALLRMDSLLGTLMQGIKVLRNPVNTILVSDHGMSELTIADETYTFLDEVYDVRSTKIRTVVSSTLAHLYIDNKSTADSMYTFLKSRENHFIVYRKPDFPKHWQYNHYRVGDVVIVADERYYIRHSDRAAFNKRVQQGARFGVHGYDPALVPDMRGIFLAKGPQIKKGARPGLVRNIDIYPLIARILGLKIPPIDGDPKALKKIYVK